MNTEEIKPLGPVNVNARGFEVIDFWDCYENPCSIQMSSICLDSPPGESAIWLGLDNGDPKVMAIEAERLGIKLKPDHDMFNGRPTGWVPYPLPPEVSINTRMHINREQVASLIMSLQNWLDCGHFEKD